MPILQPSQIDQAVRALDQGDVVGMPTETVYGLAGRIDRHQALEKIFRVKQRPFFDPLIVHVSNKEQAQKLTTDWSPLVDFLADHFWPGPLTLVLPKTDQVDSLISSGLPTVGLRCPQHPIALELIDKTGCPLAAPSANRFGRTSPTTPAHVETEFPQDQILVLDGGLCNIGIESTVLKVDRANDRYDLFILRKGLVTQALLEESLSTQKFKFEFKAATDAKASPGHMEHHYMPAVPLIYCKNPSLTASELIQTLKSDGKLAAHIGKVGVLKLPAEASLAARLLYSELRKTAESGVDALVFYVENHQSSEAWQAVLDRLYRASTIKY